jgi:transcriptional regulator with XRE-family HTH domain
MDYKLLGKNIQTVRKFKRMKQQELADAIGINLQSLSKIERGVNYPTYETLENIVTVLDVTPNELLSGEWKYTFPVEKEIMLFLKDEEKLNAELKHGHYDNYFNNEDEWLEYELKKLKEYIANYINAENRTASELYPLKKLVQYQKFQEMIDRYDDYYSLDLFGETPEGLMEVNPYGFPLPGKSIPNRHVNKDRKTLSKVPTIKGFDNIED